MKLKPSPRTVKLVAGPLLRGLAATWRYRVAGEDDARTIRAAGRPLVFVLWHEAILPLLWRHRHQGNWIVVSEARDGQYLADFAERLGYRLIRGSTTRGGARALLGAVRALEGGGAVCFTPDGPRGPRRVVQAGAVAAAQRAGVPIVAAHAGAKWAWQLHSWDRMRIPRPGARVEAAYSPAFEVGAGPEGLAAGIAAAQAALDGLARD